MARPVIVLVVTSLCLIITGTAEAQPKTWKYAGPGEWSQQQDAPTTQLVANAALDRAENLLAARRHDAARKIIVPWLKRNPKAPDRDRGLYLLAEAYYQYGDRIRAFYHLDELLDNFGESRFFYPALEKQYQIADRYLRGYKRRILGLPALGAQDEAIEMLFRIQERAPGSPLAERAMVRSADYYYDRAQYDLAADAYAAYVRSYPRSPLVPRVSLRQSFASLAQFRGLDFDATPLVDARAQLESFTVNHPEMAESENVRDVIERIDETLAGKLYRTADFYRRTDEPRAAAYTYRYLITHYPDTPDAGRAQRQLDRLPQWAKDIPAPAASDGAQTPPTQPPDLRIEAPRL